MMCIMESHVNKVLHTPVSAILPLAVLKVFRRIGEHFQPGREEDAHDFLCCTVNAMQRACLSASNDLDLSSQSTTIVYQIFGGFLRSRVTCFSCEAISDSYEAFLDVPLDIKAASSLTAALEEFVTPEHLDGDNCFKCDKCKKNVAASKRFTVHRAPKILTVCLKRFDCFNGGKISKVVEYPEFLDLRPYMSQADGEPLQYSLYAVLVHSGVSCQGGHYFCYTKASNGLWYEMDDESVELRCIDTALRQQAYLLFYARCSDLKIGERAASSSLTPPHAPSFLSHWAGSSKKVASIGPQGLPGRRKDTVLEVEDAGMEQAWSRSQMWDGHSCLVDTMDCDPSAGRRTNPASNGHSSPRDAAASGPSRRSLQWAGAPRAAQEQTLLRHREMSRSVRGGYNLRSRFVLHTEPSPRRRRRRRRRRQATNPPCHDHAHRAVPKPSSTSLKQQSPLRWREQRSRGWERRGRSVQRTHHHHLFLGRRNRGRTSPPRRGKAPVDNNSSLRKAAMLRAAQEPPRARLRELRRSLKPGYDLRSRFVLCTRQPPTRKRRVSMAQRCVSNKHSEHPRSAAVRLWPWLKQNGRLALRFLAKVSLFSTRLLTHEGMVYLHG
ncbi:ubiquitin carboxyl-terminal hydrolase 36-like isoform X2 [Zonotrichia leucophrys gambelii]|uniref:ubiquitin carboxyl-terminal hydrolase 36-like isoform X2 n=1 Tax=Zonotrichia leucophrys gambelii TaxID=257770 RepID=UPI0031403082